MRPTLLAPWLLLVSLSGLAADHRAGLGVRDITPSQASLEAGRTYMGGYGTWKQRGPASGIHDPLSARAFCIADEVEPLCIVIVDSLGLTGALIARIAAAAAAQAPITPQRILVGATHTHAAPDLLGLWGGAPQAYADLLVRESAGAISDALAALQPADLYYAVGAAPAHNRRGWGYTDEDLVVLQARSPGGERIIGSLINFAAHPTVSVSANPDLSSDFVHYLRAVFEHHTQAAAVYVNGAIGDVIPGRRGDDYWAEAKACGALLADAAVQAMDSAAPVGPGLVLVSEPLMLDIDNFVFRLAQWLGVLDDHGVSGPPWSRRVSTTVSYLRLGDQVQGVAVPGEALTRLGLDIKAQLAAPARLFLGQTGGSLGYLISDDEWRSGRNGDYEESVSLGKQAGPAVVAAVTALVRADLERRAGTVGQQEGPTSSTGD
ncbi:MAG: neutral/alkaline non-lysosomal ceramidase N-terminal domain-containing protein [Pseudomonadales bacterium]